MKCTLCSVSNLSMIHNLEFMRKHQKKVWSKNEYPVKVAVKILEEEYSTEGLDDFVREATL